MNNTDKNESINIRLIENKFKSIEEKVVDLKERVDDLDKINNVLIELKHLSQQQVKDGRDRDKMIERLSVAQTKQSNTLIDISNTTNQLGLRVGETEKSVGELNERICEERDRNVIHVSELAKSAVFVVLGAVLAALIATVI